MNTPSAGGIGSNKSGALSDENENFGYEVINETEDYNIAWGHYRTIKVKFLDGSVEEVYRVKSSGKYFYMDWVFGKIYGNNLDDAAYRLYIHKKANGKI